MKIAFLVTEFPSLSQTFVLNQITGLIDHGHNVDIFAIRSGDKKKVHEDVLNYDLMTRTKYFVKIPTNRIFRGIKGASLILKYFSNNLLTLIRSLNLFKYGKQSASLNLLFTAIPFLNQGPYDIIQCHFGPSGSIAVLLKEIGAISGKIITSFHGFDLTVYLKNRDANVYDYLFAKGDLFLPISDRWQRKLIELGCKKDKIIVHKMGMEINAKGLRDTKLMDNNDQKKILSVGRLVEKKGFKYGIEAVAKLINKYENLEYLIVGDGPLKKDIYSQINRLNLHDKIKLLGSMKHDQILDLMKKSDIFLAPSVTSESGDQEGIPVVLMEAMASQMPVISSYHSGIPELVISGENGFLVKERDAYELAKKIEFFLDNPNIARRYGAEGKRFVEKNHNIRILNEKLIQIYKSL